MMCDDCQKKVACVYITTISKDKKTEKHLCESCAQKYGVAMIPQNLNNLFNNKISIHDFLSEMFNCLAPEEGLKKSVLNCSQCGLSYLEFSHSGKLGCNVCYEDFAEELEPLIKRIHGSAIHKGKIAKKSLETLTIEQEIKNLRLKLKNHINWEEYEKAAVVRDQIKDLENKLVKTEADIAASIGKGE